MSLLLPFYKTVIRFLQVLSADTQRTISGGSADLSPLIVRCVLTSSGLRRLEGHEYQIKNEELKINIERHIKWGERNTYVIENRKSD